MMMFYFLGKGKAVREAAREGGLSKVEHRIAVIRKPVFSIATLAMVLTIITALVGVSVDTEVWCLQASRRARVFLHSASALAR